MRLDKHRVLKYSASFVFKFASYSTFMILAPLAFLGHSAIARPLRVIYLQGFNSCNVSFHVPYTKFNELTAGHPDAKMYWGCFDAGMAQHPLDTAERFYFGTTPDGMQFQNRQLSDATSASMRIALDILNESAALEKRQAPKALDGSNMDVLIAGHSHGGWLAVRTAYQLALNPRVKIKSMLTIDPISYSLCSSAWFPIHFLANTIRFWGAPGGCHEAPKDLIPLESTIAKAKDGKWINIYQSTMPYVTSGPIEAADMNLKYKAPSKVKWVTAHSAAFQNPTSWTWFYQDLADLRAHP